VETTLKNIPTNFSHKFKALQLTFQVVYVGYLDTFRGIPNPAETPTPFDPDATTILISTGGVTTLHDTGVLRF
jgi:hypothetical protein